MSLEEPQTVTYNIQISKLNGIIERAIRRVSAFLRFGLDGIEERAYKDFDLAADLQYRFWPENIEEQHVNEARSEYSSWIVGSCLRELDFFYALFLDRIWHVLEVADLHGTSVASSHKFDTSFSANTNVANKLEAITEKLGLDNWSEEFNSLSLARNCLTHNGGIVRKPRDCNNNERDILEIRWRAIRVFFERGGESIPFTGGTFDTSVLPGEGDVAVNMGFETNQLSFDAGTKIHLSLVEIAQLCVFYQQTAYAISAKLTLFVKDKGIPVKSL